MLFSYFHNWWNEILSLFPTLAKIPLATAGKSAINPPPMQKILPAHTV